jgi:putative hydroxymethylpyrimidine transport system ATP-binding protein
VSAEPKLDVRGLSVSYGDLPVLDDLTLSAAPGEFVSLVGPSGCGKSTLFAALAGLVAPPEGTVRGAVELDGGPVHGSPFGYMPQKDLLFPWRTVLDNTVLGLQVQGVKKKEARERARPLFGQFGLQGFEKSLPFQLSGGMRQRAALLRTVVQGRDVLLLDEPFGALDSLTRTEMQAWLEQVWEQFGWTVVLITHDIREAVFLSDKVLVLSARPTRVRLEVDVDLPRPRELSMVTSPEFASIEERLLTTLHEESRAALAAQGSAGVTR